MLLDLLMPDLDGYALLDRLRADARLRAIRVVVVSAHGREAEAMVATDVQVEIPAGLEASDLVRYLTAALGAVTAAADGTDQAPPAAAAGTPAWR